MGNMPAPKKPTIENLAHLMERRGLLSHYQSGASRRSHADTEVVSLQRSLKVMNAKQIKI